MNQPAPAPDRLSQSVLRHLQDPITEANMIHHAAGIMAKYFQHLPCLTGLNYSGTIDCQRQAGNDVVAYFVANLTKFRGVDPDSDRGEGAAPTARAERTRAACPPSCNLRHSIINRFSLWRTALRQSALLTAG